MPVKCREIMAAVERLAPRELAAGWDNVGLLVGSPEQEVASLLVALDVTPEVAERAAAGGVDLIVAHHPLIFKSLSAVRTDTPLGRTLATLLAAGVAVYAAHTNLDAADGGVNDALAGLLGLGDLRPLAVEGRERLLKLAVFVPEEYTERVRAAITAAGAGHIGNYSHCTFQTIGTGTFLPLDGAKPFLGKQGKLEYVAEHRLETVMPEGVAAKAVAAMLAAHPYEEVAYDLYALNNPGRPYGLGRVGRLATPEPFADFVRRLKDALGPTEVRVAGPTDRQVSKVAVCGGSGAGFLAAAIGAGADVLVTGDVKYHEALDAAAAGLTLVDAGHFATERPVVGAVAGYLEACAAHSGWDIVIRTEDVSRDVFRVW
ncbi:Nif3-like dinuclear metal center hexameric protein [Anaeroselena agilis]|uniref:GTP cyclohydrolase 1 type 2 homolog n=1 Tax=Anaeroselena agilis TaxID=3063788 RepID=A0ABU3P067_9FIRM|nr:Nif3-like dinuclear metal center hexameric protein [Selenomonadales bacterium 4137-cl]